MRKSNRLRPLLEVVKRKLDKPLLKRRRIRGVLRRCEDQPARRARQNVVHILGRKPAKPVPDRIEPSTAVCADRV